MRRFWFTFDLPPVPDPPTGGISLDGDSWGWLRRGIGVTAADEDDARAVIRTELSAHGPPLPAVREVVADFDLSALDEKHMLPNIVGVTWRGIWWPPGFTRWSEEQR